MSSVQQSEVNVEYVAICADDGQGGVDIRRDQLAVFEAQVDRPGGLVVVSGPTGQGKTTVAYHALVRAARANLSVSTVEVHPRAALFGVNQHVDERFFDSDSWHRIVTEPSLDLLYVRELVGRDAMDVVFSAACRRRTTFLTTVHTNDALSTPVRFLNAGIEPWKVAGALKLVQAQRLLRRLCCKCREPVRAPPTVFEAQGLPVPTSIFKAIGCAACDGRGYAGWVLACEQLVVDEATSRCIVHGAPREDMQRLAAAGGLRSLRVEALLAVEAGVTTVEEALMKTYAE